MAIRFQWNNQASVAVFHQNTFFLTSVFLKILVHPSTKRSTEVIFQGFFFYYFFFNPENIDWDCEYSEIIIYRYYQYSEITAQ